MGVTNWQEGYGDGSKHLVEDQPVAVGQHVLVLVLMTAVVKLQVKNRWMQACCRCSQVQCKVMVE
jgi:hypothetical protein